MNPLKLALSGRPFIENYTWRADEPTRFQVFDRATGERRGTYETDGFFCFHHVNAFERGDELVVDLCAYEDSSIIDSLYLDENGPRGAIPRTELRRYTIDLAGGGVRSEPLADGSLELPRIDYARRNTRDYSYAYFTGARHRMDRPAGEGRRAGRLAVRVAGRRLLPRRARLRARAGHRGGGRRRGAVGGARRDRGPLVPLVLDAGSFEEIARADAPHHIPFGFHGQYFR